MITSKEALELTNKANNYTKYLEYYIVVTEEKIKASANNGERSCIVDIDSKKYGYIVATQLLYILMQNGYNVKMCNQGYKKYGLWIFW